MNSLILLLIMLSSTFILLAYAAIQGFRIFRAQTIGSTHASLKEMFLQLSGSSLFTIAVSATAALSLMLLLAGHPVLALFALASGPILPKAVVVWLRRRRRQHIDSFLPDSLIMIAGAIRAGAGLQVSIQNFGRDNAGQPLAQEFDVMLAELRLGLSMDEAFLNMNKRINTNDFLLVTTAIRIARETGGNLSETLERLADTLRQKAVMEGKIKALTSQGKLQGIVVGLLPLILMAVLLRLEPEAMAYLFSSVTGWLTLAVILTLEVLGAWMIHKITTIDV